MFKYVWAKIFKRIQGAAIIHSTIARESKVEAGSHVVNSIMDKYSFCGYNCEIVNCEIGKFCSIANGVIIGGAFHPIKWVSTSSVFYGGRDSVKKKFSTFKREKDKKTCIGCDVWIGNNVLIKQGVKIGHGAVIGMGSVVTKDIPPYEIWAGNPAHCIRKRFEEPVIEQLLKSRWWDLKESDLQKVAKYIQEPDKFLKACEEIKGENNN